MAGGVLTLYNHVAERIGDGGFDMDTNTFNIVLLSSGYTPSLSHTVYADISADEIATANGYTAGGAALTGVTWAQTGGVATFDSADQVWTASGGSITARYAALRQVSPDLLLGYFLLDTAPADVTATDGNTLTVGPDAVNGWFKQTVNPV